MMARSKRRVVLAVLGVGLLASAGATTCLVGANGTGDYRTIQAAMDAASYGDTVLVMPGIYHDCTHLDSYGRLCCVLMKPGVCLQSQTGQPDDVTIDAQQLGRVIFSQYGDALTIIRGITMTGGLVGGSDFGRWGGGLRCDHSSPMIENCVFGGNSASAGGGMACNFSFIGNTAADGAGLEVLTESEPLIEDCRFAGNEAQFDGGGIYYSRSSGMVRDCLFTENRAAFWGAGIYCQSFSSPDIRNCTLCLNHCHGGGSGIYASSGSSPTVERTIVAFNTGSPGISTLPGGDPSTVEVLCCDVYGHPEDNYGGDMLDQTGLNDNISADPCFCDLENDDFTLWNYSPCAQVGCGTIGAYPVACWDAQDIVDSDASQATRQGPLRAFAAPNPFSETTSILFTSSVPGVVRVGIFDMAGREVRGLVVDGTDRGSPSLTWEGRDHAGQLVSAGVYWVRASQGDRETTTRVTVLR